MTQFLLLSDLDLAMGYLGTADGWGLFVFFFSSRRRHTRLVSDWSSDVCSSDLLSLAIVPLAWVLRGKHQHAPGVAAVEKTMSAAVRDAWNDPSFLLLTVGFFVCGFHVAFIATHLPGVVALCGLPPAVGAWALSLIGLFNIAGSFASGWAIGRWRMKSVLSLL